MIKENILISFSGGETSAYMLYYLTKIWDKKDFYNFIIVFANTGDEEEETLLFVKKCEEEWKLNIIWVEAFVNHNERIASGHKIVNFKSASRNREPFIEVIKKYGIPNSNFIHCNREMKLNPIKSYMKSLNITTYKTAIGIRNDEIDRVSKHRKNNNIIYPFIEYNPKTKEEVSNWWSKQDFRLKLKSYNTNCRTCWKKSDKVLAEIYRNNPEYFEFNKEMERLYGKDKYTFFREGRSTKELIKDLIKINKKPIDKSLNTNFQCNLFVESCDIFSLCDSQN
tara:strand:+ start:8042 stop:8884 length:843 start_codon:yes stop_codon:yes gene_type:complete